MHRLKHKCSTLPILNTKLFMCNHNCQTPIGKKILQGIPINFELISLWQLDSSLFPRGKLNMSLRQWGDFNSCHKYFATSQPLKRWSTYSLFFLHILQMGSRFKSLEPNTSPVGTLLWRHNHKKNWTLGGASTFHTHAIDSVSSSRDLNPLPTDR